MFAAISALSLGSILVRELSRNPEKKNMLLGTSYFLRSGGAVISNVLIMIIAFFITDEETGRLLILVIAGSELFKGFEVIKYYYSSRVLSKYYVRVEIVQVIFNSVFKLCLVYFKAPLIWFGYSVLLTAIFHNVGYLITYYRNEGSVLKWKYSGEFAKNLLAESWPLVLYGIGLSIQNRIDQVMLGNMVGNYEVGQYSVGFRLILMATFIPTYISNTFAPAIAKAKKNDAKTYEKYLLNNYRILFMSFLVVSIPIFFIGDDVVLFLYGNDFKEAGIIFSLFAFKLFFTSIGIGKSSFIVNESLFKFNLLAVTIGTIVNITCNYFLIPIYGAIGALVSTYISFTFSHILVDLFYYKTRKNQILIFKGIFSFWKVFKELDKLK